MLIRDKGFHNPHSCKLTLPPTNSLQFPHNPKSVCRISDIGVIAEARGGTHVFGWAVVCSSTQTPAAGTDRLVHAVPSLGAPR